jgi:hypothetical protein
MRGAKAKLSLMAITLLASVAIIGSANAAVIIKTIRCAICVTDTTHPNACKNVPADGRVVVSEDAMQGLEGELGQGATIMEATSATKPASERRRRHSLEDQTPPPQ